MGRMFVVFDLDGTLSDDAHRAHHLAGKDEPSDEDYAAYFALCGDDPVFEPVAEFLRQLWMQNHRVEIWTGRPEHTRAVTEVWLDAHVYGPLANWIPPLSAIPLRMRADADHGPVQAVKGRWLAACERKPDLVLDDRTSSVHWWRGHGILCWQVQENDY